MGKKKTLSHWGVLSRSKDYPLATHTGIGGQTAQTKKEARKLYRERWGSGDDKLWLSLRRDKAKRRGNKLPWKQFPPRDGITVKPGKRHRARWDEISRPDREALAATRLTLMELREALQPELRCR
jgi:hypothetical protein